MEVNECMKTIFGLSFDKCIHVTVIAIRSKASEKGEPLHNAHKSNPYIVEW